MMNEIRKEGGSHDENDQGDCQAIVQSSQTHMLLPEPLDESADPFCAVLCGKFHLYTACNCKHHNTEVANVSV